MTLTPNDYQRGFNDGHAAARKQSSEDDAVTISKGVYDRLRDLVISFAQSDLTRLEIENAELRAENATLRAKEPPP